MDAPDVAGEQVSAHCGLGSDWIVEHQLPEQGNVPRRTFTRGGGRAHQLLGGNKTDSQHAPKVLYEQAAVGQLGESLVERHIGIPPMDPGAIPAVERVGERTQLAAVSTYGLAADESGDFCLEREAYDRLFADILRGENADARAGARERFEKAFMIERSKRLRDRRDAHPEFRGDVAPREQRARSNAAIQYPVKQLTVDLRR